MNIENREQFEALIKDLRQTDVFAVDTETNGLNLWEGHRPISMSFYFPSTEHSYNFAWGQGEGIIDIPAENRDTRNFHSWKWTGKGKKQVFKTYWFEQYKNEMLARDERARSLGVADPNKVQNFFGNCPLDWLDELRVTWNNTVKDATVIYYNAPFDIHMMHEIGFNQPLSTYDVRIAVSLAFEDWNHPSIGGNNRLKWQAAKWNIPGASEGEDDLSREAEDLSIRVAQFALERYDDPMNASAYTHKTIPYMRLETLTAKLSFDPKAEMWCLPSGSVAKYAENDTRLTWLLHVKLLDFVSHFEQATLYKDLSQMQSEFLCRTERNGILLDKDVCETLIDEMQPVMAGVNEWFAQQVETGLDGVIGLSPEQEQLWRDVTRNKRGETTFSVTSNAKLQRVLSVLTPQEWTSTAKSVVQKFEDTYGEHPALEKLKEYRHAQRAVGTYLKKWLRSQDEHGYIHGNFNASGTKTGRLSSSSGTLGEVGNFQNIPSHGFDIKRCLIAPPGYGLFQIDYSALELRLASWIAGCSTMIEQFERGVDLHAFTRDSLNIGSILHPGLTFEQAWHKAFKDAKLKSSLEALQASPELAKKELLHYYRQVAKTLNFGLLYSGTWRMVSRLLKLDEATSRTLHIAWNNLYPEFREANEAATAEGRTKRLYPVPMYRKDGTPKKSQYIVQPISLRTRKFDLYPTYAVYFDDETEEWVETNPQQSALKDGFNFKVQGLGGYIMVMSALKCCREFDNDIFKPFATIHDSLDFYLRDDSFDILPRIVEILCDWDIRPRLQVEVEYSSLNWQVIKGIENLDLFVQEHAA